jgi:hypothetical protein
MADNLSKGLTEKSGFNATKEGPALVESKSRPVPKTSTTGKAKKNGKSFSFK